MMAGVASPVEAQLILCDAAVADPGGKVHMLGAGWSVTGTPTAPQAVAVLIKIPWDRANEKLPMTLRLVDGDGQPVVLDAGQGGQAIGSSGEIEVGRPPRLAPGSPIDASFVLNVQPMPLPPGRYEWRLDLGTQTFGATFEVRSVR
jgi:hypothetical protein